jgi:hypothetical protein
MTLAMMHGQKPGTPRVSVGVFDGMEEREDTQRSIPHIHMTCAKAYCLAAPKF